MVIGKLKKFVICHFGFVIHLLFVILILTLFTTPVSAQTSTPSATSLNPIPYTLYPNVSPASPAYTDLLMHNMFHTFSCLATGSSVIGQPCLTYQMTQNAQGAIQSIPVLSSVNLSGGTLGAVSSLLAMLYTNPPVKTADYLASVGQGLGIVKEAHAQVGGSGEGILRPILTLWQVSRNISYSIMILIFVIIGLMIMFRQRINPQTVITAQAALPGLVIGLILITFSYFLAALLSDFAFIGTNLVGYYFSIAQGIIPPPNLVTDSKDNNVLSIVSQFVGIIDKDTATNTLRTIWDNFSETAQFVLTALGTFVAIQTSSQATAALEAIPLAGKAIQAVLIGGAALKTAADPAVFIGLALSFIATAMMLHAMFKLLLRLINNYLNIIFLTITAPFQFLAASLPGRQSIATGWMLNMLCNVLAFPAVFAVIYFIAFLLGPTRIDQNKLPFQITATTGIISTSTFPMFGGLDLTFINLLLAFGAMVALPAIPDIICRTIGRVGAAGQLLGQEIGSGYGAGRQYGSQFQSGIGSASGQLGQARGIFGTTEYMPGANPGDAPVKNTWTSRTGGWGKFKQAFCLPPDTLIATPFGHKAVKNIRKGDIVWTISFGNKIKQASVKQLIKRKVSKNHQILRLVLADNRQLLVSAGHPDSSYKDLALLNKGDFLDRSYIIKRELLAYAHKYTYDILPEGETGTYFANNILIGSTLKTKKEAFQFYSQGLSD